jgi:hypothetical protein
LKKKHKKKKKTILEEKMEKKHAGKVKVEFSTSSILKKKFDKDNFEKKHVGKHCSKTNTMWGNIVTIHSVLKKKTTKQIDKDRFGKKKEERNS